MHLLMNPNINAFIHSKKMGFIKTYNRVHWCTIYFILCTCLCYTRQQMLSSVDYINGSRTRRSLWTYYNLIISKISSKKSSFYLKFLICLKIVYSPCSLKKVGWKFKNLTDAKCLQKLQTTRKWNIFISTYVDTVSQFSENVLLIMK